MLDAAHIVRWHDEANVQWHQAPLPIGGTPLFQVVIRQHLANFDLWHREDDARDPHAADSAIVQAKRDIDRLNQERNELVEYIDLILLRSIPAQNEKAPLHSETPGMMIDRLSILSLKRFHTEEEARRA